MNINLFLKNSSYLLIAQSITKVGSFVYVIFLARQLGVTDFGFYIIALSYFGLVSSISDFGFSQYFVREVAKDNSKMFTLIPNIIFLRLITAIILIVGVFILTLFQPQKNIFLIIFTVIAVIPQIFGLTIDNLSTALQKFYIPALNLIILISSSIFFGIIFVLVGYGSFGAILGLMTGQILYLLTSLLILKFEKITIKPSFDISVLKRIFIESLPYGFLFALGYLYFRIDILMLSYFKGSFDVGIYGIAYRFYEAIIFIPSAFIGVLFPILAKISDGNPKDIYRIYLKATYFFLGISIFISLGYIFILPIVITYLLPQYLSSIQAIKILALSIPFFFIISPQAALLTSQKRFLKPLIIISIFNLILNIVLNLLFIPKFSYIASSWITVVSDMIGFIIFFILIRTSLLKKTNEQI